METKSENDLDHGLFHPNIEGESSSPAGGFVDEPNAPGRSSDTRPQGHPQDSAIEELLEPNELEQPRRTERGKSSMRLRYEAQTRVLIKKIGDLEDIRAQLGLSQRKICQLLMVDPSAWTRWTRPGESAPPHIYRALQWYLALEEKYPTLDVNFWLTSISRPADEQVHVQTKSDLNLLQQQFERLFQAHQNQAQDVQKFAQRFEARLHTSGQDTERLTQSIEAMERTYRNLLPIARQVKILEVRQSQFQWLIGGLLVILLIMGGLLLWKVGAAN